MATIISLLYFVYQSGIAASNVYSFLTFARMMYPYVKDYGDRIPYDDLETVYRRIIKIYRKKVREMTPLTIDDDTDTWLDLDTSEMIKVQLEA